MRSYFANIGLKIGGIPSEVEARVVVISSIRHLLQVVNYSLLEWIAARNPEPELQPPREILQELLAPSDGTLVDGLEALLICAEQNGWSGAFRPLVKPVDESDGCVEICGTHPQTLSGLLRALVEIRNDGGEGHGLPGGYRRNEEKAALDFVIAALDEVMPKLSGGDIEIGPSGQEVRVRMIRAFGGHPILVRKIKVVNLATVRIQGRYYNENGSLESVTYDAWSPFSKFTGQLVPSLREFSNTWRPLCSLPERITDSFIGRDSERKAIVDWLDDQESRACLVYGDGGVGKTTLVVEVLHQILEEDLVSSWQPKVVSFYTAKRLQFGVDGLAPIGAGRPHLMDLLAHLHVLLLGKYPDAEFYKKGVMGAAMVLQERMRQELDLKKADHLVVVDNAETLIESDEDRDLLGQELKEIARRVGRVLITSRRREILGADPVEVKALSKLEAVKFLRVRGETNLKIAAIKKAADVELLAVVEDLERRPIVLEAFINALGDPSFATLEKAKKKVLGMLQEDLGTFLFSDAWARLSKEIRKLLVLMTRVADVHDAQSFRICADLGQIPIQDAEKALEESSGIASVVHVGGGVQIAFSRNFLDYCKAKDGVTVEQVALARARYSQFLARARTFSGDRILEAFRSPLAKAAHRARSDGDLVAARDLYEQAILSDSANGLLFDRYAYFLFHQIHDNEAALHQAKRATELLAGNGECWYTRGLIEARLGDSRAAVSSLSKAESLGVAQVRCALQLAWAYLKSRPKPQLAQAELQVLLLDSITSSQPANSRDRLEIRNISERLAYLKAKER